MDKAKLYDEIEIHLIEDIAPSIYFNDIIKNNIFKSTHPFTMLSNLIRVEQNGKYHPEGNVWNHTMMVVDEAAKRKDKSKDPRVLMWSALLHDIGKAPTTKIRNGRITSYKHERVGRDMAREFLREFINDDIFIEKVSAMVRWHMEALFVLRDLPFADIPQMLKEVPLEEIALLNLCDRLGRGKMTAQKAKSEEEGIKMFAARCRGYDEAFKKKGSSRAQGCNSYRIDSGSWR